MNRAASAAKRLDLRLAVPALAAWVTAAIVPVLGGGRWWWSLASGAAGVAMLVRGRRLGAAALLGVAVGAATTTLHLTVLRTGPVAELSATTATRTIVLRLVRDPREVRTQAGRRLLVTDATVTAVRDNEGRWRTDAAPVVVFAVTGPWLGLLPGQRLALSGRLRPPRRGDDVTAALLAADDVRLIGRPPWWQRWAGRGRDALRAACAGLSPDQRGLVPGLVLGDVSAMPPALVTAFRITGLTHLNAVSGANVAIVLGAVTGAVRRLGARRHVTAIAAGLALAGFVVLARPSPSVLRAAVMGAVVLVAAVLGRRTSAVPLLSAAVLLLIVVNPFLATSPGFAMSVLATAAIVLVAPAWTERLSRRMPRPVAAAIAVPAAAQLACTPVLVAAFGQLTPLAVPANLLAAPAVAPATLAGVACALTAVVLPALALPLAWAAGLAAGWLALVARGLAAVPGAGVGWPTGWRGVGLLGLAVMPLCLLALRRHRRARRGPAASAGRAMLDRCRP